MNSPATLADNAFGCTAVEIKVVGRRPKYRPYLRIAHLSSGQLIASVDNANALRGLARRILRALDSER